MLADAAVLGFNSDSEEEGLLWDHKSDSVNEIGSTVVLKYLFIVLVLRIRP